MRRLRILDSNQNLLAVAYRDPAGGWVLEGENENLRTWLEERLRAISARPIRRRSGYQRETPRGAEFLTTMREVQPSDPDYLEAVAETLMRTQLHGEHLVVLVENLI